MKAIFECISRKKIDELEARFVDKADTYINKDKDDEELRIDLSDMNTEELNYLQALTRSSLSGYHFLILHT